MSQKKREAVFAELDELIASPFADVPQTRIPENWRAIIAEQYDVEGLMREAAEAMREIDLEAERSPEAIQVHALAARVAENERMRQARAGIRARRRIARPRKPQPTTTADRERELRARMQEQRANEKARRLNGARNSRWRQAS